jgi:ribosomal protein S18 acetylase RimI-like enzyme
MKIERIKKRDVTQVLNILIKTPEIQGSKSIDEVYTRRYVEGAINSKDSLILVAKENKKVVGVLVAEIFKKRKYSVFVDFGILEDYREQGIGSKLYDQYEKICEKERIKVIELIIHTNNKKMKNFLKIKKYKQGSLMLFYDKVLNP